MTFRIQALELRPRRDAIAARRARIGRVWADVATPKRRRATAERLAQYARVDNPDALVRVVVR
jgi:hypothetical protein